MINTMILVISAVGVMAGFWLFARVWPIYQAASGRVQRLLKSILTLFAVFIGSNLFWIAVILIPEGLRAEGGPLRPVVIAGFLVVELAPLLAAWYLWRQIRP